MPKDRSTKPARPRYDAEQQYNWLTPMLDAYAIHEDGLAKELARETEKRGQSVACGRGCAACCDNASVPITPFEMRVVSWYVSEELPEAVQDRLKPRLLRDNTRADCPFLLDRECSIHPVRPLACRGMVVFRKACEPHEHVVETRPEDIFIQSRDLSRKVGLRVLDSTSWPNNTSKRDAFERGVIPQIAKQIHELDWSVIARSIDHFRGEGRQP